MNTLAQKHLAWCILDQAIAYVEHGLSVLPLRLDGSKAPACKSWKNREHDLPGWKTLEKDFAVPAGIGVVCGVVSGGLEVLDFDAAELFPRWREKVTEIVAKLPVVKSPKGYHVWFRCDCVSRNAKIAFLKGRKEAAIETRGEGGYIVAPGSPSSVHPSGKLYEQISGPTLPRPSLSPGGTIYPGVGIPVICEAERAALWQAARSFDQKGQTDAATEAAAKQLARQLRRPANLQSANLLTPWGHFDAAGPTWRDILEPHGWTSNDGTHWRRPGKLDEGHSAVVRIAESGCEVLVIWSSSAGPLAPIGNGHRTLGKFEAYAALHHNGNRRSAASELSRQGWGRRAA